MKSKKKILALVACAVLLVVGSVMATMAWLTSQTEVVENTFTVGNVVITLDEAKVTEYGVKDGDSRVLTNEYKLIPGHTYVKDPTIHVAAGSEPCWLFVKVDDPLAGIEADDTIADQLAANGWAPVAGKTNVYAYAGEPVGANTDVPVFGTLTIRGDVSDLSAYKGLNIDVQAYAIQADGFATAADAWASAPAW